jgi:hypothetical protein
LFILAVSQTVDRASSDVTCQADSGGQRGCCTAPDKPSFSQEEECL